MSEKPEHDIKFQEIYLSYYPRMKRFAREYVLCEEDAENIVQDIFLELWEQRNFMSGYVNLAAYLFTSVKNRCIDFLRRKTLAFEVADKVQKEYAYTMKMKFQSLEAFDEKLFSDSDIEPLINKVINSLPEKCREIFVMNKIEGKKQKAIAEELNISIHTVESQMSIAYKKLKDALKDYFLLFVFFFI